MALADTLFKFPLLSSAQPLQLVASTGTDLGRQALSAGRLPSTWCRAKVSFTERYREAPEAALITLRAQDRIGDAVTCK